MCHSSMMVMTENHSRGAKYTYNPWMTTFSNTWRLQQNCPAPRCSSLRCLLPSVWKLVALSHRYRATPSKQPEPDDSAVLDRARPFKSSGTCSKPPREKGSTWTHTAHTFPTGPLLRICTNARTLRLKWRTELDSKPGLVWWPSCLHSWSTMHFYSYKKEQEK